MDPFRLTIAFGPLALYLLLLGTLHLGRRPFLTTGGRDLAALALAISGLVVVGPLELFLPEAAIVWLGSYVWLLMLGLYALTVSLVILLARPRLVVYNATTDELRPILARFVGRLDPEARWAGDSLSLPRLGVQLHVDPFPALRNVSLVANGSQQSFQGWRRLEVALAGELAQADVRPDPRGVGLVTVAAGLLLHCLVRFLADPAALAQGFRELLQL